MSSKKYHDLLGGFAVYKKELGERNDFALLEHIHRIEFIWYGCAPIAYRFYTEQGGYVYILDDTYFELIKSSELYKHYKEKHDQPIVQFHQAEKKIKKFTDSSRKMMNALLREHGGFDTSRLYTFYFRESTGVYKLVCFYEIYQMEKIIREAYAQYSKYKARLRVYIKMSQYPLFEKNLMRLICDYVSSSKRK
jgi:hypothetical protein